MTIGDVRVSGCMLTHNHVGTQSRWNNFWCKTITHYLDSKQRENHARKLLFTNALCANGCIIFSGLDKIVNKTPQLSSLLIIGNVT